MPRRPNYEPGWAVILFNTFFVLPLVVVVAVQSVIEWLTGKEPS